MNIGAAKHCFAHQHLTPPEYGLYVLLRELSSKNGYRYHFDDRTLAKRFASERGTSRHSINRLRRSLVDKGFIRWDSDLKRGADGKYDSRVGYILSHKEWAAVNPGKCITTSIGNHGATSVGAHGPRAPVSNAVSIPHDSPRAPMSHNRDRNNTTSIETNLAPPPVALSFSSSGEPNVQNGDAKGPWSPLLTVSSEAAPALQFPPGYELRDGYSGVGMYGPNGVKLSPTDISNLVRNDLR